MTRAALPPAVTAGVVAVLRADDATAYAPVCAVLAAAGVRALELTLTTPGTIDALPELAAALPDACFGVGTVLDAEDARRAVEAGARFLVTPGAYLDVVAVAREAGIPVIAGALTPTEVSAVWAAGASAVKIFPASAVGDSYLTQLRGPFPDLPAMPSGGVGLDDIAGWIAAGAVGVSLGGPLLGDALRGGDPAELGARARRAVEAVAGARRG